MWSKVKPVLRMLCGMIWPDVCEVCGCSLVAGEDTLCLKCIAHMPRLMMSGADTPDAANRIASTGRVGHVASMYFYDKESEYASLIHKAKYNGRDDIARKLGRMWASELVPAGFFDGIDVIVPVPVHWTKMLTRGYNQSHAIACGIASVTGLPVKELLRCPRYHGSQTRRSAHGRWLNVQQAYRASRTAVRWAGRNALVVDDVITTGSTVLVCCRELRAAGMGVSVLSLALARPD